MVRIIGRAGRLAAMSVASDEPEGEREGVESRQWLDRLIASHGGTVHRYCAAMLGEDEAVAMVPLVFAHVYEHAEAGTDPEALRGVVHAVARNRCIQRSREGGRAPQGPREWKDRMEAWAVSGVSELRPIGRDVFALRQGLGLGWAELEEVCGVTRNRGVQRVCRAWRIAGLHATSGGRFAGEIETRRPVGRVLDEEPETWATIREEAEWYFDMRAAYRRAMARWVVFEGLAGEVWRTIEEAREEVREEERRGVEREAEKVARVEAERIAEAERTEAERVKAEAEREKAAAGGGFVSARDGDEEDGVKEGRSVSWWVAVGVGLAAVGLAARWLVGS